MSEINIRKIVDHPAPVQVSDCSAPASRPGFSGELILLSVSAETLRKINAMKNTIRKNLANVDQDVARVKLLPSVSVMVPMALERKAIVVGKLTRAGDTSFGDPEKLFEESHTAYLARGVYDGYNFFFYASFLASAYGERTQPLSAYQFLHDCHQLGEALLGVARFDRVLNAAAGVVLK